MKKIFFSFVVILLVSSSPTISQITKYFGSKNISLDDVGVINFIRYLDGRFYSEDSNREMHNTSPMYYAISEDGKIGYGWFCRSHNSYNCYDSSVAYKLMEYCKEYTNSRCAIFAYRNEIVWNNKNIIINDLSYSSIQEILNKNGLYKNISSSKKINDNNYLVYTKLLSDRCSNRIVSDLNLIRGAGLDCLLPGRDELTIGDQDGSQYSN